MKLKKFLSALVSGAMILGTLAAVPVFADETKPDTVYVKDYDSLQAAVEAVADGGTVNLDENKSYSTYGTSYAQGKSLTFVGAVDEKGKPNTTWYYGFDGTVNGEGGADYSFNGCESITFKNVKMQDKVKNANYRGFVRADNLVFENCTFDSRLCYLGYESTTFKNCVFEDTGDWSLWCYTGNEYVFDGCTFNTSKKGAINIYMEHGQTTKTQDITIKDCTFTQTGDLIDKCALQVNEDGSPHNNIYNINVSNVTINGNYATNDTFGQLLLNKGNKTGETLKVTVDGKMIFPSPVAKVGDTEYITLAEAVAAALNGGTVTLLRDAEGDGVVVPGGSNVTIDLNGFTYNVSDATVGSAGTETSGFQLLGNRGNGEYSRENNTKVTIKNGTLKATSPSCWILIQNYSDLTLDNVTLDGTSIPNSGGTWPYTLSNNFGSTTITGATNIIAKDGGTAFDCYNTSGSYKNGVSVTFDEGFTGKVTGPIEYTASTTATANSKISISGGTFTTDVADYVADGYYQKKNDDKTYTVSKSEAKIIDSAKTTGATVTLDNLTKNAAVDHEPDATYQVVVSTPSADDADAANAKIAASDDSNTSKAMFDISVVKTDSNGTKSEVEVKNQPVTLTLGETPDAESVKVYHVDGNGNTTKINDVNVSGKNISFIAPSFSTYTVTYNTGAVDPATITELVGVVFSPVSQGSNQYYINLKSLDGKSINRFMSTDLVFNNGCATVDYDITPAANMTASVVSENGTSREYRFNMDGRVASSATGTGITIGTITFYGYGTLNFGIDSEDYVSSHAINIVNTAEAANNIVANYIADGDARGNLFVNNAPNGAAYGDYIEDDEKGVITDTLKPETKDLTVNIAYNNAINNNAAAYQDMTVTISGGDLQTPLTVKLGTTSEFSQSFKNRDAANKVLSTATFEDNTYKINIKGELTQNVAYTVTVEGAGYRTARYTVNMKTDKELNFWNNVMDSNNAKVIEVGTSDENKVTKNFLAGDIVKDNQINIYDLSAVVSYFGETGLINENGDANAYARYDLNRDGKIDSKDVAYVLVSWNK